MKITNNDIKESIKELFKNSTDPEIIKSLGAINEKIDLKEKEDNDFVKKYETLTKDYREAVMNAGLPAKHTADESGGINKAKSLEEIIAETIKK